MRAVAERWIGAVFALAPPDGGFFGNLVFHRLQTRSFVGAIAEWLMCRTPAGTPPMSACFNFECHRFPVANDRLFSHGRVSNTFFRSLRGRNRPCRLAVGISRLRFIGRLGLGRRGLVRGRVGRTIALRRLRGHKGEAEPEQQCRRINEDERTKLHGSFGDV